MSYRFKVTFFYNKGAEEIESLSYYVKSVELPVWNISTENRLRFGNTQYVIPTFDFGQSTLKIVFMETDNMSISYFLNGFLFNNIENTDMEMNLWNNCAPAILKVKIDELEPSMRGTVISNIYACHLKRLSTPKFGNTSLGTPVEIEAEFVVRYKLNSITTEIGAEPREIKDPDSLRKDILEARQQEEKIKEDIIGINAKMQALAFADVEAKRKQKKDLQTKKKGLEAQLAQKEKERAALEAKINKEGADITALLAKKKQLEAMLALRNKTRKQAGLKPIYGFTEEESAINGFLDQEYINNNVTDATGIVSIDASILSENGKVDVDELMAKLNQYGIKFNVSRHGDTFENLAAFSSLFTDKELGTIEYISMSKADYEKFDGLSTTDILNVLSDIQSIDQQLAQHERHSRELKQNLKDLESVNNDISALKSDIAKTDSDIRGVDAELREMADTKIYSASESKGENGTGSGNVPSGPINIGDLKTGTGYMAKDYTPNLKQINADAKNKGYDLTKPDEAAAYMYKYGTADKGLKQCTRGPNLTIQLMAYAKDEKAGKDMTGREYYKSGPAANLFDPTKSSNETIRTMYDKDSSYENMTMNRSEFESTMSKKMTKAGDFVTFKIEYIGTDGKKKYSQHTVMANYDNAGNLLPFADFRQKTLLGYSGTDHKITDIHFFSNKEQHS